jgi:hypothetical protein
MLKNICIDEIYKKINNILTLHHISSPSLEEMIYGLFYANFECYKANMTILEYRSLPDSPEKYKIISDAELIARTVGEKRVKFKANINLFFSQLFSEGYTAPNNWVEDDIVCSIGEMLDRILIEHIKQQDFRVNEATQKIENSVKWQNRVLNYLEQKIDAVGKRGFYECIEEMRTYELRGNIDEK